MILDLERGLYKFWCWWYEHGNTVIEQSVGWLDYGCMLTQCYEDLLVDLRQSTRKRELTKMTPRLGFCVSRSIKMLLTEMKMTVSEVALDVSMDHIS